MLKRILSFLFNHIVNNIAIYSICTFFLVVGIVVGTVYGTGFVNDEFFASFFTNLDEYAASNYVKDGFLLSLVSAVLIFVCSISPIGCIVLPFVIGYKGFVTGYTVSAFFTVYGFRTLVFIVIGIIPSAIFWLPVYMLSCVNGIRTSYYFFRILSRKSAGDVSARVGELGISCIILFFGVLISRFAEIFIIPQMLNLVGGLYV